jgi:hypothetical protein
MATYYVRVDGSDANTGLGSSTSQAWQTISKALGATGIGSGDTLYIAPGTYRQGSAVVVGGTYSAMTYVYGDPTGAQFTGVPAGLVRITTFTPADTSASSAVNAISITSKSFLTFANLLIETGTGSGIAIATAADNLVVQDCVFTMQRGSAGQAGFSYVGGAVATGVTVQRCQFFGGHTSIVLQSTASALQNFRCFAYDNICEAYSTYGIVVGNPANPGSIVRGLNTVVANNVMIGGTNGFITGSGDDGGVTVRNNAVINATTGYASGISYALGITASNNLALSCGTNFSSFTSTSSRTAGVYGFDIGEQFKFGLATLMRYTNWLSSPNIAAGSTSNAPATDQYNVTWYSTTPDIGAVTYRNVQNILPTYAPTERNASTITIPPGSTSQSVELYLGATGLAFNTSGLAAYYVRNQSAPVAITLVTQTPTGAWTSGGFAEISSSLVPGVYRLDVPNAAFAAGASDVTIVVRGASGTNGAVLTVTLSSGGLTAAQTASAVWGASVAGYSGGSTFGGVVTETSSVVNGIEGEVQDVPSNVWEELRANHDTAGSFGEYVNAELVTPVTSAALVRMGPFEVRADGLGASDPLDIQKGAQHGIDIQCVDNNGAGIDITSATVTAKVYNSGATLVDTYSCTATYAADGRATFTIDTTVTNTPGTYTATITRTTGASDTQIFGPLRIYVRDI